MRNRVVVVDDDDISRRGLTELITDRAELEVVGSLLHDEALGWDAEWNTVDIAIVDAADSRRGGDHFPGAGVVGHIRRRRSREQTMVIVLSGHIFDDAVRRRMREAEADYFYHRSELQDSADLFRAILHPEDDHLGVPERADSEAQIRLGIGSSTGVDTAVSLSDPMGLRAKVGARASDRGRSWSRLQTSFNDVAHLNPINVDSTLAEPRRRVPQPTQLERFLKWASRVKDSAREPR